MTAPQHGMTFRRSLTLVIAAGLLLGLAVAARAAEDIETCYDGEGDEAIAACTRAITSGRFKGAALASLYHNRGYVNSRKGEQTVALEDYTAAITLGPKDSYYNNRASAYFFKKEYDRALADLDAALALNPNSAPAFFGRGNVYKEKGEYDRAIGFFGEAVRIRPDFVPAWVNRGDIHLLKRDYDLAIADFDAALKVQPGNKTAAEKRQRALDEKAKGKS